MAGGVDPSMTSILSPSFDAEGSAPGYELKFLLDATKGDQVVNWASERLTPDPYGDSLGCYETSTIYLDTPDRAVALQMPGYRVAKYRVRRYGESQCISLERKKKRGDRVRKARAVISLDMLSSLSEAPPALSDEEAAWFRQEITAKNLRPAALVSYRRRALIGEGMRLTIDADICAQANGEWAFSGSPSSPVLAGSRVLELKFAGSLPRLFRELIVTQALTPTMVSKYRNAYQCLREGEPNCPTS